MLICKNNTDLMKKSVRLFHFEFIKNDLELTTCNFRTTDSLFHKQIDNMKIFYIYLHSCNIPFQSLNKAAKCQNSSLPAPNKILAIRIMIKHFKGQRSKLLKFRSTFSPFIPDRKLQNLIESLSKKRTKRTSTRIFDISRKISMVVKKMNKNL